MSCSRSLAVVFAALVAGCGSQTRASAPATPPAGMHNVLTESELLSATDRTVYETIVRLRPSFLRSRQVRTSSTPNPEPPHVYVNGTRAEGLDALKLFVPHAVKEVRFFEPPEANVRFGPGHNGGLIAVTLQ
jgi:hypothetical protein